MEALTKRIRERLATVKFCIVFENELERVWPTDNALREERAALIHAYAKENGWSATVSDPGMRVTFKKLSLKLTQYPKKPTVKECEKRDLKPRKNPMGGAKPAAPRILELA